MMKQPLGLIVILMSLLLVSCSNERKDELELFIAKVKRETKGNVEPLPTLEPYEAFTYTDRNLRSPFVPPPRHPKSAKGLNNGISPDETRNKEALEAFSLDSLKMVGTIEKDNKLWAVIQDKNGTVHRVSVGNYVGENNGKIDEITPTKIYLTEIVPDGLGGWEKRKAFMALAE